MNVLITGASSEIAIKVSKKISHLKLYGISRTKVNNVYEKCWIVNDYTKKEINNIFNKLKKNFFDSIIIFNGLHKPSFLTNYNEKLFDKIIEINYKVPMMLINQIMSSNIAKKKFSINFISSVAGIVDEPGNAYYSLSKSLLIKSSKMLANELKNKNFRINSVTLGLVKTQMSEKLLSALKSESQKEILKKQKNKFVEISDIVSTLVFLIKNDSINGQNIILDRGYSL